MAAASESSVRTAARLGSLAIPALTGLVASAALLVDYVRPSPVFCDGASGCEAVKHTVFASIIGVPTPVYGVLAFLTIGALAFLRGPDVRRALLGVSAFAALFALGLLGVQLLIGHFCPFCVAVDTSAILVFVAALTRFITQWDPPEARARALQVGWGGVVLVALAAPLTFGFTRPVVIPDVIARELAGAPRGVVTVVDFVDFECPFCRATHAELAPVLDANKGHVRVVRKQVPLTRIHPHSLVAARAACCAEELGKGDAMADALFTAPLEDLTPGGCEKLASGIGLDPAKLRACMNDPRVDARIEADSAMYKAAKGRGLPTLWVDGQKVEGAQPREELERVVQSAIAQKS